MFSSRNHLLTMKAPEIDLKPFINFLVVLIPVLMLSAEFSKTAIVRSHQHLPGGSIPGPARSSTMSFALLVSPESVTIVVNDRCLPTIRVDGSEQTYRALGDTIARFEPGRVSETIVVGDPKVPYQRMIDLLDILHARGFGDVAISRFRI